MRFFVVICCYPQVPWSKIETQPTTCLTDKRENNLDRPTQKNQGFFFSMVTLTDKGLFLLVDVAFSFGSVTGSSSKKW
jgi:hypothetical protein